MRPDAANLYIYRTSNFASAVRFPILVDGHAVGELPGHTFALVTVPPGQHTIHATGENGEDAVVSAEPGKNYYFKVTPYMGIISARVGVAAAASERDARVEIADCNLIQGAF